MNGSLFSESSNFKIAFHNHYLQWNLREYLKI